MIQPLITQMVDNPKKLFLLDGIGAIVSAFFLGVVLVQWESLFGIPVPTLYFLAGIPILFALYDLYAYQKEPHQLAPFLTGIAIMNVGYCCLSLGLAFYHRAVVTAWGWGYIIAEVAIILVLVVIELGTSNRLK